MCCAYTKKYSVIWNETLSFIAKCIELEDVVLSETRQTQNGEYYISN